MAARLQLDSRVRLPGVLVLASILAAGAAWGSSNGIVSFSGNPATGGLDCNECHSGGVAPTVTIEGPTTLAPGAAETYLLRITGGQNAFGGLDVSASDGALGVADPGTRLESSEIVHNDLRAVVGGSITWTFNWTAPLSSGTYTLYGAGNSVNGGNGANRDRAATATLDITVAAAQTPGESSGPAYAPLRVESADPLTGEVTVSYESACETTDNNLYFGPLDQVAMLGWSGEECAIGTSGQHTFVVGPDSYFFVVVGNKGADEGSYGAQLLPGGGVVERSPFAGNACGQAQDLSASCD